MNAKNQGECRDPEGEVTQGEASGPQEAGGGAVREGGSGKWWGSGRRTEPQR